MFEAIFALLLITAISTFLSLAAINLYRMMRRPRR